MGIEQSFRGKENPFIKSLALKLIYTWQVLQDSEPLSIANLAGNKCLMMDYFGPIKKTHSHLAGGRILR